MNFGYSNEICTNMLDKSISHIDCSRVQAKMIKESESNVHADRSDPVANVSDFDQLERDVCRAEIESQKLMSDLDARITPLEVFFSIIVTLFLGAWSDRHGKRKLCLILPSFGFLASLLSVYY